MASNLCRSDCSRRVLLPTGAVCIQLNELRENVKHYDVRIVPTIPHSVLQVPLDINNHELSYAIIRLVTFPIM